MLSGMNPELFARWQQIASESSCPCEDCNALRAGPAAYIERQVRSLLAEARSLDVPMSKIREWVDSLAEGGRQ